MRAATRKRSKGLIDHIPSWALREIRSLSCKTAVPFAKMRDVILGLGIYAAKEQMAALLKEMDAVPNLLKSAIELAKLDPNAEPENERPQKDPQKENGEERKEPDNELRQLENNRAGGTRMVGREGTGQSIEHHGVISVEAQAGPTPPPFIHENRGVPADLLVGTLADPPRHNHAGERPEEPGADYTLDGYIPAVPGGDVLT